MGFRAWGLRLGVQGLGFRVRLPFGPTIVRVVLITAHRLNIIAKRNTLSIANYNKAYTSTHTHLHDASGHHGNGNRFLILKSKRLMLMLIQL